MSMNTKTEITDNLIQYVPPPTLAAFMKDDAFARFVVGPLGSGKSMAMIMEGVRRMVSQAPDSNGVRPTRAVVIRNTLAQIKQTCLDDMKQYLRHIMVFRPSDNVCRFNFPLNDGTTVESEWILMPIEDAQDTRRLLSLQLTFAWVSEFREVNYDTIAALQGRIGRYPSKARVEPTWAGLFGESNPFSEGSQWYDALELHCPDEWRYFRQPGGLDPDAENRDNLPENYYENLINDATNQEWINVHVHGQYGEDQSGQRVYRHSFNNNVHVHRRVSERGEHQRSDNLLVIPDAPIVIGIDFGRTPAAVFCQDDFYGRTRVLDECVSDDMHLEAFILEKIQPTIYERYRNNPIVFVGDPTGNVRSQTSDVSPFSMLKSYGFKVVPASTNDPYLRISAVEKKLLDRRASSTGVTVPALVIDAERCPTVVWGFRQDYKYKKRKMDGRLEDKPDKTFSSHVHDALQYACLGLQSNYVGRKVLQMTNQNAVPRQKPISRKAWT